MPDARELRDIAATVGARLPGDTVVRHLAEIAGGFDARLHRAVIAALPPLLAAAFSPAGARPESFDARVEVAGDLAELRALAERTTLVIAPTHSSNLDAIVLGLVLARAGLPPPAYAAGKHVFRNRVLGAAMRRLGAFCLDPDRRDRRYLQVVQAYTTEVLARGVHTVIFPGGTRCRTGEVESAIKLGLLGAALRASRRTTRPIAIVPVTINYQVVLEAEWLTAYHLAGRAHERIVGDELFTWSRLGSTARRLRRLDQRVAIKFGRPIDPLAGDARVPWRARLVPAITRAYRRDTVLFASHVVARALYDLAGGGEVGTQTVLTFPEAEVARAIASARGQLRPWLSASVGADLLADACASWDACHRAPVVITAGGRVTISNLPLVWFYRNRTLVASSTS